MLRPPWEEFTDVAATLLEKEDNFLESATAAAAPPTAPRPHRWRHCRALGSPGLGCVLWGAAVAERQLVALATQPHPLSLHELQGPPAGCVAEPELGMQYLLAARMAAGRLGLKHHL